MLKHYRKFSVLVLTCATMLLLAGCGVLEKRSMSAEATSTLPGRATSAVEAYLSAEDPLQRWAGAPAYWPPAYNQAGRLSGNRGLTGAGYLRFAAALSPE